MARSKHHILPGPEGLNCVEALGLGGGAPVAHPGVGSLDVDPETPGCADPGCGPDGVNPGGLGVDRDPGGVKDHGGEPAGLVDGGADGRGVVPGGVGAGPGTGSHWPGILVPGGLGPGCAGAGPGAGGLVPGVPPPPCLA